MSPFESPYQIPSLNGHRESTAMSTSYPNPTTNSSLNIHRAPIAMPTFETPYPTATTENASLNIRRAPTAETPATTENASLNIHRGAIDQTTVITTRAPRQVMERMGKHLQNMGMHVTQKTSFRYRCLYPGSASRNEESSAVDEQPTAVDDRPDVVRFTVELTLLVGLKDTYSLDIRRLRGPLKRYKLIYDDIRDRARSCAE